MPKSSSWNPALSLKLLALASWTASTCWVGEPTTRISPTSWTIILVKLRNNLVQPYPEIYEQLVAGGQIGLPEDAEQYYVAANNAIRDLVPMVPVAHGASRWQLTALMSKHPRPARSQPNCLPSLIQAAGISFVWMQNADPSVCSAPMIQTVKLCALASR